MKRSIDRAEIDALVGRLGRALADATDTARLRTREASAGVPGAGIGHHRDVQGVTKAALVALAVAAGLLPVTGYWLASSGLPSAFHKPLPNASGYGAPPPAAGSQGRSLVDPTASPDRPIPDREAPSQFDAPATSRLEGGSPAANTDDERRSHREASRGFNAGDGDDRTRLLNRRELRRIERMHKAMGAVPSRGGRADGRAVDRRDGEWFRPGEPGPEEEAWANEVAVTRYLNIRQQRMMARHRR